MPSDHISPKRTLSELVGFDADTDSEGEGIDLRNIIYVTSKRARRQPERYSPDPDTVLEDEYGDEGESQSGSFESESESDSEEEDDLSDSEDDSSSGSETR